jgi:hypothetical protein
MDKALGRELWRAEAVRAGEKRRNFGAKLQFLWELACQRWGHQIQHIGDCTDAIAGKPAPTGFEALEV